jgi:C4-dicarboxylate-specific signal transduction histidine kinase
MIAHQWRQPLSAITAATGVLSLKARRDKLTNETALEIADKIKNFSMHLSSTIDDFRNFFKSNKEKNLTNYSKILTGVLHIIESSLQNNKVKLEVNIAQKVDFISYENEIKQVLLNLIKNAEDALVENNIKDPYIIIDIDGYTLSVKDNAGGIDNDIMKKIFDPYFSTKTKKDGTGLGLYMSKLIIEDHCGGLLKVSNGNDGAIFSITLEGEKI